MIDDLTVFHPDFKLGVLGGGQLGKMLALAAGNWHLPIHFLDASPSFPAAPFAAEFVPGSFKSFQDVYDFGKNMNVLTIEIEHVNTEALQELQSEGIQVHPAPDKLDIIKDKGLQKQFYQQHGIPSSPFHLFDSKEEVRRALENGLIKLPFVQKSRTAGYDGRGVAVLTTRQDLSSLLPGPCLIEDKVDIDKELALIVARSPGGEMAAYPAVEMEFNPQANLVEYLLCPARIDESIEKKAEELAISVIEAYDLCGLLAVELFLTKEGTLLVNEVAPRPHNSGHHTIDSCYTSQFEQHLRAVLDLPLGSTKMKTPSVMVNLLGAEGHQGPARYEGIAECMALEGVKIHLYGKTKTRPFRKMGHVTILDKDLEQARAKAEKVKNTLRVVS